MVANHTDDALSSVGASEAVDFAGDGVQLAGQIDYPESRRPENGYPLIFIIQHATCMSRVDYEPIAKLGTDAGLAVFRWDKRGTGKSGSGSRGSVDADTMLAYQQAVKLPSIDASKVIIFAQSEGTLLLAQNYKTFQRVQHPLGIILAGNMLDAEAILPLDCPIHIIISKNDWNDWRVYAESASDAHATHYNYDGSFYVATNTNRLLRYSSGNTFHKGSETSIKHWLEHTCQIS